MKRSWLGLGLLIVLLVGSILSTWALSAIHEPAAQALAEAADLVKEGKWQEAGELADQAKEQWERRRHLVASLMDHEPVEELEAQLARLDAFREEGDAVAFRAHCLYLASTMEAMGEAQQLKLWNLL